MSRQKRGSDSAETCETAKDVDCEIGVFSVAVDKNAAKGMKPKQRLRSLSFCELNLRLVSQLSYRETAGVLNRVLHREGSKKVKTSTLEDWVESFGKSLSEGYMSKAEDILDSYSIDKQSGIISEDSPLPPSILKPEIPAVIEEGQVRHLITEYNRGKERAAKLKYDALASGIEDGTRK